MRERLSAVLDSLRAALARLNPRERMLVVSFLLLTAVSGVYVFAIEPMMDARERAAKQIETLRRDMQTLEQLASRVRQLEADVGKNSTNSKATKDFSLFSFVDRATSAAIQADSIASMNPTRRKMPDGVEETAVELRLEDVSLSELVGLLRQIELAEEPVYIKRLDLRRRYDDRTRFDAVVVAGALSQT